MSGMILVIVEFVSDVADEDWNKFHSFVKKTNRRSKVIIVSRHQRIARFGSVKPIFLNPSKNLQPGGSLLTVNALADVPRMNLNVQFWLCMLNTGRRVIQKNLSEHGVPLPPYLRFQYGHSDITDFALHASSPIRITPWRSSITNDLTKTESPKVVTFRELLVQHAERPKEEFSLLAWESRMPPYTKFAHMVASSTDQDLPQGDVTLSGRKR
ncbi:hypothetical protein BRADI_1g34454v3 [Brachypodium distachyon]|uniref:NB-ARC domain-containing protein n=1 Tax=Brachypodium distachyon TaxID=15368 RepID=A0A0Q3RXK8_BRADI|nr:hypothetical protein BRADI_1g34454v3 [Brachypodium distachyon]